MRERYLYVAIAEIIAIAFFMLVIYLALAGAPARSEALATQCVESALAGGTGDVLTVSASPCTATSTLLILTLSATNTGTSPTLQATGGAAQPIKNADGSSVGIGQLASGTIILLTNTGSQYRILNGAIP